MADKSLVPIYFLVGLFCVVVATVVGFIWCLVYSRVRQCCHECCDPDSHLINDYFENRHYTQVSARSEENSWTAKN